MKVLENGIVALRYKTELELKLSDLPTHIWDVVLQKKMQVRTCFTNIYQPGRETLDVLVSINNFVKNPEGSAPPRS